MSSIHGMRRLLALRIDDECLANADKYKDRVRFVCGCAGLGLAKEFGRQLRLRHCSLTYIKDMQRNGPKWGQLGCNGFIILTLT